MHVHSVQNATLEREPANQGRHWLEPDLSPDASARPLIIAGARRPYCRDQEIYQTGEPADRIYGVLSGVIRVFRPLVDGRRHIAQFCLPGDVFGLESDADHQFSAEAVIDCEISSIARSALAHMAMQDAAVGQKLWSLSLHYLCRSEEHLAFLGHKNARGRVAWFLLDMAKRTGAAIQLSLPMSREDIADFLGLSMETVSRTMHSLQHEQMITLASAREVLLKDRMALHSLVA